MKVSAHNPEIIVNEIFALYEKHGGEDYIGEPVSQLEHMSQAAALATDGGYDDEVILAAFFHDIGHLCASHEVESMDGMGNVDHEKLGADYLLERGFSSRVADLVKSHVTAKRYLTYKFPEYYARLSPASRITLDFQGGVMNAEEAAEFESHPDAELMVHLRYWDDKAKEKAIKVSNIAFLKQLTLRHLSKDKE
ncbi:MAG TPA: HDIG domain-containing protein [Pedobacter sp.]